MASQPPNVYLGLIDFTLPNGQTVKIPKSFLDRLNYDLSVSGQRGRFTAEELLGSYFGGSLSGRPSPIETGKMYSAYGDLKPFLQEIQKNYVGEGRAVGQSKKGADLYAKQEALIGQRQMQQDTLRGTGAVRQYSVVPSGQVQFDTGQKVTGRDIQRAAYETGRVEKKLQNAVAEDLQKFEQQGTKSVVSNLPVTITRSTNPDVRGSMAKHLQNLNEVTQK